MPEPSLDLDRAPVVRSEAVSTPMRATVAEALAGPWRAIPILLTLAVTWLFFYTQNPAYLSVTNITNLALQIVTTAILALGIVFVLLVGEIDLSAAALSGVAAAIAARLTVEAGWPLALALGLAMIVALLVAILEGLIVTFGVPSLIVTLGGSIILQGALLVALAPTFSINVGGSDFAIIAAGRVPVVASWLVGVVGVLAFVASLVVGAARRRNRRIVQEVVIPSVLLAVVTLAIVGVLSANGGLPIPVLILAAALVLGWYLTTKTRYGVHLYAVGGNREAAKRAGIPVARIVMYSFVILGVCAAIAGVIDASRLYGVSASSGGGTLMLNAIAAAVVGGTSLFGGRGTVWTAVIGALVIGSINNGVQLLGLPTEVQFFATGSVLIVAVALDVVVTRGSLLPKR